MVCPGRHRRRSGTGGHLLSILTGIRRTNFAPGVEFSYSNTGYVLAAAIIRRVTGMSLREFGAERIFGALGMADTMGRDGSSEVLPRFAYGYGNDDGVIRRADTDERVVGDGGLATSVADLAHWLGFLADRRVLGADIRAALLERTVLADGTVHPYALNVHHFTVGGKAAYGRAGSVDGYRSQLLYVP
ncbi:serine hydrolase domain-containing protein [Streptomyces sp. NPDC059802]|uniref:serine hydrolase domain-containing protein n=1 Tax=Streptomyces sp. NPDC059802 TaxID=3346952 RepID=UPI00366572B6